MQNVTLLQLQTTILQRTHMENSQVVPTAELTQDINDSGSELNDQLAAAFGAKYNMKQQAFSLVGSQDTYPLAYVLTFNTGTVAFGLNLVVTGSTSGAKGTIRQITGSTASGTLFLSDVTGTFTAAETITDTGGGSAKYGSNNGGIGAADFMQLQGLDANLGGRWVPVSEFKMSERAIYQNGVGNLAALGPLFAYRFQGQNLIVAPAPVAAYSMRLYYTPTWTQLINATDVVDSVDGWLELVVLDVCIKILAKQDLPCDVFMQQKMAMLKRIEDLKQQRNASAPPRVIDINEFGNDWPPSTRRTYGY